MIGDLVVVVSALRWVLLAVVVLTCGGPGWLRARRAPRAGERVVSSIRPPMTREARRALAVCAFLALALYLACTLFVLAVTP